MHVRVRVPVRMHVRVCVGGIFVSMDRCMWTCGHMHVEARHHCHMSFPCLYFLTYSLSLNLKIINSARLAGQWASRVGLCRVALAKPTAVFSVLKTIYLPIVYAYLPTCTYVHHAHVWYLWKPEEVAGSPATRVMDDCELPCGSSVRAGRAFKHWAISQVPWNLFLTTTYYIINLYETYVSDTEHAIK